MIRISIKSSRRLSVNNRLFYDAIVDDFVFVKQVTVMAMRSMVKTMALKRAVLMEMYGSTRVNRKIHLWSIPIMF